MDDDTKRLFLLISHTLDQHTANQAILAQNQTAILGVLQAQQSDQIKTGDALASLVEGIKEAQAKSQAAREAALQRMRDLKDSLGTK